MAPRFRTGSRTLSTAALVTLIALGGAAPTALAHDSLRTSFPEAGYTVTEFDMVSLTFSDALLNLGGNDNAFDYAPAAGTTAARGPTQPLGCGGASDSTAADSEIPDQGSSSLPGLHIGLLAGSGFIVLVGVWASPF